MNDIVLFWMHFNWLELVTYIIIPLAIFLIIGLYIYVNYDIIKAVIYMDN